MSYNIAVIPARKGSKRLHNKNFKPIRVPGEHTSLALWSVLSAARLAYPTGCSVFDKIIFSSDNEEYNKYLRRGLKERGCCHVIVHDRPADLGKDNTPMLDVILDAIGSQLDCGVAPPPLARIARKEEQSTITLLQPTSPIRKKQHVIKCLEMCLSRGEPAFTAKRLEIPCYIPLSNGISARAPNAVQPTGGVFTWPYPLKRVGVSGIPVIVDDRKCHIDVDHTKDFLDAVETMQWIVADYPDDEYINPYKPQ